MERPSESKSRAMKAQRVRDTAPELRLRREIHRRGLRYRVDQLVLPRRRADIVFGRARVAVFVDGCFWHGCPDHASWPKTNAEWWRAKIERNRERDAETTALLTDRGWTVVRTWEHEDPLEVASWLEALLRDRSQPLCDQPEPLAH